MPDKKTDYETALEASAHNLDEVNNSETTDIAAALSNICPTCDNLFNIPRSYKVKLEPIFWHHTLETLKSSARECEICALLDAQVTAEHIKLERENEEYRDMPLTCLQMPSWLHYWAIGFCLGNLEECVAAISLIAIPDQLPLPRQEISKSTNSEFNLRLAKELWIQLCKEGHPKCKPTENIPQHLPARLLSIGKTSSSPISLCTSFPPGTVYATLSHVWGSRHFISLTRSNYDQFINDIPFSLLPKTFQDAVFVARELGFEYLWIDSLCIIQGPDHDDWYNESGKMAAVYGGGALNIAASGADHGGDGLFVERDLALVRRCLVWADGRRKDDIPEVSTTDEAEAVQGPPDTAKHLPVDNPNRSLYYCIDGRLHTRTFNEHPIFARAWVFQERYLAPRTLHFGRSQIFYECQTHICFETLPLGIPPDLPIDGEDPESREQTGMNKEWRDVVKTYTRGKLTKSSDKLVAISGVAKRFEERFGGGGYLFGLWGEVLPAGLLWQVSGTEVTRAVPPRAPTWSWASVDGIVYLNTWDVLATSCRILELHVPDDPYGHEVWGLIKMECEKLLMVTEVEISPREPSLYFEYYGVTIPSLPQRQAWEVRCSFDNHSQDPGTDAPGMKSPGFADPIIPSTFYLLDVVQRSETAGTGLIIERVRGQRGYFKRIGRYLTGVDEFAAFKEARRVVEDVADVDDELYESVERNEEDGEWRCIINLI